MAAPWSIYVILCVCVWMGGGGGQTTQVMAFSCLYTSALTELHEDMFVFIKGHLLKILSNEDLYWFGIPVFRDLLGVEVGLRERENIQYKCRCQHLQSLNQQFLLVIKRCLVNLQLLHITKPYTVRLPRLQLFTTKIRELKIYIIYLMQPAISGDFIRMNTLFTLSSPSR